MARLDAFDRYMVRSSSNGLYECSSMINNYYSNLR